MISIILCLFIGMLAYVTAKNGETGSFVIAILIIAAILILRSGMRRDSLAWMHCRDYWAKGGTDTNRRVAERKVMDTSRPADRVIGTYICPVCKEGVCADVCKVERNGRIVKRCTCPLCGEDTYFGNK